MIFSYIPYENFVRRFQWKLGREDIFKLAIGNGSLHQDNNDTVEITIKMQPCNRIHYSTVYWRLNMFRAAYCSSSEALTVFAASGLHTYVVTGRSQVWVGTDSGRSPHAYVNQRLQIQLELLMMSGMPLETCWAFNERWDNEFYYKVASCWLFLLSHTTMHGSMNIKKNIIIMIMVLE